jgi:L-fuconolactonase
MTTIDAHQHFWHYDPVRYAWLTDNMALLRRDFLPADLEPHLRLNGIDGCVAVQAEQSEAETEFLLHLSDAYEFVRGVVGWVDLRADDLPQRLAHFSQFDALKGFRHVAQSEAPDFLARPDVINGIRHLADYDFSYDILIYPNQLKAALHLVRALPDVRFVIDHLAKPDAKTGRINTWSNFMGEIAKQPNVCCKLSGLVTEADWRNWQPRQFFSYLDVVFGAFGPDRLLFGSDWPVCYLAADYTQVKHLIEQYTDPWGEEVRQKIFGANAIDFYRL